MEIMETATKSKYKFHEEIAATIMDQCAQRNGNKNIGPQLCFLIKKFKTCFGRLLTVPEMHMT